MECAKQAYWKRVRKQPEGHNKPTYDDMIAYADNSLAKKMFHKIRRRHDEKVIQNQLKEHDHRYCEYYDKYINILSKDVWENQIYPHSWKEHNHKQKLKEAA